MPFISPEQGSTAIAVIQFSLSLWTLPTILNRQAQVPSAHSVPTATLLWVMAVIFALMGLETFWTAALGSGICALGWTLIVFLRPVQHETAFLLPISMGDEAEPEFDTLPDCNRRACGDNGYGVRTHVADCARSIAFHALDVDMGRPT